MAGDLKLGEEYVATLAPLVWHAAERTNFVPDVQKMRRRVVENIPVAEVERELKPGPGGCAMSNSPCSYCSWCTGGPIRR